MYQIFIIQQFYVLPTQCIYLFKVDLRTNNIYFPIQKFTDKFYNTDLISFRKVLIICTTFLKFNNSQFFPHSVLMWLVWIWGQRAFSSLYKSVQNVLLIDWKRLYQSGHWIYGQFNIHQFFVLPTECTKCCV